MACHPMCGYRQCLSSTMFHKLAGWHPMQKSYPRFQFHGSMAAYDINLILINRKFICKVMFLFVTIPLEKSYLGMKIFPNCPITSFVSWESDFTFSISIISILNLFEKLNIQNSFNNLSMEQIELRHSLCFGINSIGVIVVW